MVRSPILNFLSVAFPQFFTDAQQYTIGSCTLDDIACTVATRVIGHYPHRNQLLIDCGFAALTKQGMGLLPGGCVIFRDHADIK